MLTFLKIHDIGLHLRKNDNHSDELALNCLANPQDNLPLSVCTESIN